MKPKEFFKLFTDAGRDLYKNPVALIIGLALWGLLIGLSKVSVTVNQSLSNTITISAWLLVFFLVSLAVMSFVFSGLITLSKKSLKGKTSIKEFLSWGDKFWFRSFSVLLILVIVSVVIGRVAHYGGLFIGGFFGLDVSAAQLIFILIYLAGLLGILIFLSVSIFCVVIYDLKIIKGIRRSIKIVKGNYLSVLPMSLILFVILFGVNKIPGISGEILEHCLFVPYFAFLLTRFVIRLGK